MDQESHRLPNDHDPPMSLGSFARRSTALFTSWLRGCKQESLLCGYLPGIHNQYWKIHENVDFEDESRPIERAVDTEARAHVGTDAGKAYE